MALDPQVRARRLSTLTAELALGLFLLGMYTGIDLRASGSMLVPYVVCAVSAPFFLVRLIGRTDFRHVLALLALPLIALVGSVFAPQPETFAVERAKGVVHLAYSVFISYGVYRMLGEWPRRRVARLFGGLAVALLVGCVLENYGGLRSVSDAFRHAVFDPAHIYDEDVRDLLYAGMVRPKLFTEEPSFLALFFVLSAYMWFMLSEARFRLAGFVGLLGAGLILIRSPVLVLGAAAGMLGEAARADAGPRAIGRGARIVLIAVAGVSLIGIAVVTVFSSRIRILATGGDLSTLIRVVAPVLLAREVVGTWPVWGIGITSEELVLNPLVRGYAAVGLGTVRIEKIINAFWLIPIYFGALGGTLVVAAVWNLARRLAVPALLVAAGTIAVLAQGLGAFVGLRTWYFAFMVVLAHQLACAPPRPAEAGGA